MTIEMVIGASGDVGVQASRMGMRLLQASLRVDGDSRLGMVPHQVFLWNPYQPHGDAAGTGVLVRGRDGRCGMALLEVSLLRSFLTRGHFLYTLGEK